MSQASIYAILYTSATSPRQSVDMDGCIILVWYNYHIKSAKGDILLALRGS